MNTCGSRPAFAPWLLLFLAACQGERPRDQVHATSAPAPSTETPKPAKAKSPEAPTFATLEGPRKPGRYPLRVTHDGSARRFLVQLPDGWKSDGAYPMILSLHGGGSNAMNHAKSTATLAKKAQGEGVLMVYPQGMGNEKQGSWNAWTETWRSDADDVGFLVALIEWAQKELGAKKDAVFMTGFSNGAAMTQRFAAEQPGLVAGFVACGHSSHMEYEGKTYAMPPPKGPVNILLIRGGQDASVPPDGEPGKRGKRYPTVEEQRAFWRKVNGCPEAPDEVDNRGDMERRRWKSCEEGKALWAVYDEGLAHNWPSKQRGGFDGGRLAWSFFFER